MVRCTQRLINIAQNIFPNLSQNGGRSAFPLSLVHVRSQSSATQTQTQNQREIIADDEIGVSILDGENDGIAVVSLRRHKARNAMGRHIMRLFTQGLDAVKFNKLVRVVIIRSEVKGVFCAGADLKERAEMTNEEVARFVQSLRGSVTDLANLPMPTIAAIDGYALGGGLEMALGCDMRVASTSAKLGLVETSLAIIPGAGGTQRLSRVIGPALAKELIFTSRVLGGEEARQYGIVNQCRDQNEAGDAAYQGALELAREIIPQGPIALRMAKLAVSRGIEVDLDSGLKFEETCYAQIVPTKDRIEGLKAFKEKRKPVYKGE